MSLNQPQLCLASHFTNLEDSVRRLAYPIFHVYVSIDAMRLVMT